MAEDGATECAAFSEEPDGRSTAAIRVVAFGAAIAGDGITTIAAAVVIKAMAAKILLLKSVIATFDWLQQIIIQATRSIGYSVHHKIGITAVIVRLQHFNFTSFEKEVTIIRHSKDFEASM